MQRLFERAGLTAVRIDAGRQRARGATRTRRAAPRVVVSAHLDTVFPTGTDVRGDAARATCSADPVSATTAAAWPCCWLWRGRSRRHPDSDGSPRAVRRDRGRGRPGRSPRRPASVRGPLKGQIGQFHVPRRRRSAASCRRASAACGIAVTFSGPGGHSYGSFGMANPIHALGRAVSGIAALQVPASPKTTFNVGRVGGGTSVNSIASSAWMEVDLRSRPARTSSTALDRRFRAVVDSAVSDENQRWNGRGAVTATVDRTGFRPTGETPPTAIRCCGVCSR